MPAADSRSRPPLRDASVWRKYGYTWVTAALFAAGLAGHWILGWYAFVAEQQLHGVQPNMRSFIFEIGRDTLENWQSEFLQLMWQIAGLAFLLHVSSPQSHENDDRVEAKIDKLLEHVTPSEAHRIIAEIDAQFDRH
jgi:hypothetical protein